MSESQQILYNETLETIEHTYLRLIEMGLKPQQARGILPNDTKTEVMVTMNLRSWRHFLKIRTDKHAQIEIRTLAKQLLGEFQEQLPIIFGDICA
jgi:thymidylate synthase (FAD)